MLYYIIIFINMKALNLAKAIFFSLFLTSCDGGLVINNDDYSFKVGKDFSNISFKDFNFNVPNIEDDYSSQTEETLNYDFIYDVSSYDKGSIISIKSGGTYLLTGENLNVSFDVDCNYDVTLILTNLNIISTNVAPINVTNCKNLTLYLPSKTKNYLSDSKNNVQNSTIFANSNINIQGDGYLFLNSFSKSKDSTSRSIYSKGDIKILNSHIVFNLASGRVIEGNNIKINSAQIKAEFAFLGGIVANGDCNIKDTLYIYNGGGDSIKGNNLYFENVDGYIKTNGKYVKVDKTIDELDKDGIYFIKNEADYNRINLSLFNGIEAVYSLKDSAIGFNANNNLTISNSKLLMDTDDNAFNAMGKINLVNNEIDIKTSNIAINSLDGVNIKTDFKNTPMIKIYSSYDGINSNNIKIDGGLNYIVSSNVGLNTYKAESNLIEVVNQDKLFISSSFKGFSLESDLKINNSLLTLFSSKDDVTTYGEDNYLFELVNSTLVSIDPYPYFNRSNNEPLYMIALNQKFEKNSALNFYNDDFMLSIILPSNYENVYLSIASNELHEDSYRVSKDGFINYAFDNNVSLNIGKPKNDNLIKNINLNSYQLSY